MRTRPLVISLALSALAACNLYFGGDQDHTPPPSPQDAWPATPDGRIDDDAAPGPGSDGGCHTPDAGSGWDPDAAPWFPDGGGVPDAQPWPGPDGGCC